MTIEIYCDIILTNFITMKKKIIYWILQKIHLPTQQELLWKIRLVGKLHKNDYVLSEEDKITVLKECSGMTKIIELFIGSNKSKIYIKMEDFVEYREGNLEAGLLGVL